MDPSSPTPPKGPIKPTISSIDTSTSSFRRFPRHTLSPSRGHAQHHNSSPLCGPVRDYRIGAKIGSGSYGEVYKCQHSVTGQVFALKRLKARSMTEIELLTRLSHRNVVRYFEQIEADGSIHLILELVEGGSLYSMVKEFGVFPPSLAATYISQALRGLVYLHENAIIHRDLKAANILSTKKGCVKLADFGLAIDTKCQYGSNAEGSPYWMAPEVLQPQGPQISSACDVWSLGMTVVELLTGHPIYYELPKASAIFRIVTADQPPLPRGIADSGLVLDFCRVCFSKDPLLRPSARDLLGHEWIAALSALSRSMLFKAYSNDVVEL